MAKQCPLFPDGKCDYPDLLDLFPGAFREQCASGGECLLRRVPVIGTDDGSGSNLNFVRAREFSVRFAYRGMGIPAVQFERSAWDYVRGTPI